MNTVFVVVTVFAFTVVAFGARTPRQEQAEEYASLFLQVAAHCGVLVALRVVALQPLRSSRSRSSSGGMPVVVVTVVKVSVEVVTSVIVMGSVMVSVTTVVSLAVCVAVTVQGLVIVDVLQAVVLVIVLQTVTGHGVTVGCRNDEQSAFAVRTFETALKQASLLQ